MRFSGLLFVLFILVAKVSAQDVPIGTWTSHNAFRDAVSVAQSAQKVYYASRYGVFSINKSDMGIEVMSKSSGHLSSSGILRLGFNNSLSKLLVVYEDGNMDVINESDGSAFNISDLRRTEINNGNKTVNHIFFEGKIAYLSSAFGLMQLDMEKLEVRSTTFTSINVNASARLRDTVYISTDQGIYRIDALRRNLADFTQWSKFGAAQGAPSGTYLSSGMVIFKNQIYADVRDTLKRFNGQSWLNNPMVGFANRTQTFFGTRLKNLNTNPAGNIIYIPSNIVVYRYFDGGYSDGVYFSGDFAGRVNETVFDTQGQMWAACVASGAVMEKSYVFRKFLPTSPFTNSNFSMDASNGVLWVSGGGTDFFAPNYNISGFYQYEESKGEWSAYNALSKDTAQLRLYCYDILGIRKHPTIANRLAAGSWQVGIWEYDGTTWTRTTGDANIPLFDPYGGKRADDTRVPTVEYDKSGNLWMMNYYSTRPLVVKTAAGQWYSFALPNNVILSRLLAIDRNGYKWMNSEQGLAVYDNGKDLASTADDRKIMLTTSNSNLPSNSISWIEADREGSIWVATTEGVVIFRCGSSVFTGNCKGERPVVTRDNFNQYLLKTESVNGIEADGANRKWIATENGVFLLSADGETEIAHYTVENSPLPNNSVSCLTIDPQTGMVYMGTTMGLVSFRGEATQGISSPTEDGALAFPNPVRPDYQGPIAIRGLAKDAIVKITDITGQLIYETKALGGQMVWDGMDYTGRRPDSGVFLVFSVDAAGLKTLVTKIAFVN